MGVQDREWYGEARLDKERVNKSRYYPKQMRRPRTLDWLPQLPWYRRVSWWSTWWSIVVSFLAGMWAMRWLMNHGYFR